MRFLAGADIQTQVRTIASHGGKVMAAVAYWGRDAAKRTGLSEHRCPANVRIICDLLSGACNPDEIEALKQLGFCVKKLDRLHAKVWIGGDDVIVGSANASQNGLLGEGEQAAKSNVEAAILSHDPTLASEVKAWFEQQWCHSSKIEDQDLAQAREIWKRRQRSGGRGFTPTLIEKIQKPGPLDRFSSLRLIAYLDEGATPEAEAFVGKNSGLYYTDEEWQDFGEDNPWYEWPLGDLDRSHGPGTVFMDFTCSTKGSNFTFNGFWEMRKCPNIELEDADIQLTLLTKLPHFNGYSLSPEEKAVIASKIRETVAQPNHRTDKFGSYIDEVFLEFWDAERGELRQWLLTKVVEAAQNLCRTGRFDSSLTLRAIRVCMEDPAWLSGYARFVGGDIYRRGGHLKRKINPDIATLVKASVGAEDQENENGRPVTKKVKGEIIQSYTLFRSYDPKAV